MELSEALNLIVWFIRKEGIYRASGIIASLFTHEKTTFAYLHAYEYFRKLRRNLIIMRFTTLALFSLASGVFAGNCGPENGNAKCAQNECCEFSPFLTPTNTNILSDNPHRQPIWMVWHNNRSLRRRYMPQAVLWLPVLLQAPHAHYHEDLACHQDHVPHRCS